MYTLALEGATYAGSAALLRDGLVVASRTIQDASTPTKAGREERMLPSVAECLEEAGARIDEVGEVVCGGGPGSFTSLRVAGSIAKGIAIGRNCPMYAVSSLTLSVASARQSNAAPPGFYLSVLPAMRGDWFALLVEITSDGGVMERGDVSLVNEVDLANTAHERNARVLGPHQDLDASPNATGVVLLLSAIRACGPVDIETWEPDYGRLAEAQVRWEAEHGRALTP